MQPSEEVIRVVEGDSFDRRGLGMNCTVTECGFGKYPLIPCWGKICFLVMANKIDGIIEKLKRANENIANLNAEMVRVLDESP
jgi:hypothetical protein